MYPPTPWPEGPVPDPAPGLSPGSPIRVASALVVLLLAALASWVPEPGRLASSALVTAVTKNSTPAPCALADAKRTFPLHKPAFPLPAPPAALPEAPAPAASPRPPEPARPRHPQFDWPAEGLLTSCYGPREDRVHVGIDIAVSEGSPVRAARAGRVVHSGWMTGYGNMLLVEHELGYFTVYAHNQRNLVDPTGDGRALVEAGQVIAIAGRTGNASGPHIHFEIRQNIDAIDPLAVLPRRAYTRPPSP